MLLVLNGVIEIYKSAKKSFFHYLSYLQYPLTLLGLYFALKPYFLGVEVLRQNPDLFYESLNSILIFMGLGVSFSSLQETSRSQNKISRKIWENPLKGKIMISLISFLILFLLVLGLLGYYSKGFGPLKEVSLGFTIFGVGRFDFLKAAIEMFENHRLDKKENLDKRS